MNKIYKVVWSKVKNCYVVVSEIAKNVITGSVKSAKIGSTPVAKGLALGAMMAFVITGNVWAETFDTQQTVSNKETTTFYGDTFTYNGIITSSSYYAIKHTDGKLVIVNSELSGINKSVPYNDKGHSYGSVLNAVEKASGSNIVANDDNYDIEIINSEITSNSNKIAASKNDDGESIACDAVISISNRDTLISESEFTNNTNKKKGGAINYSGGTLTIEDSKFSANTTSSDKGGAISIDGATLNIDGGTEGNEFSSNTAASWGGAINSEGNSTINLTGKNTFSGNKVKNPGPNDITEGGGGAIGLECPTKGDVTNNKNNGDVLNIEGTVRFDTNSAYKGGAIFNAIYCTVNVGEFYSDNGDGKTEITFQNNKATNEGGAIYNAGILNFGLMSNTNVDEDVPVVDVTFSGNTANGSVNDICNSGVVNINRGASVTLDGGISNAIKFKTATYYYNEFIRDGIVNINGGTLNLKARQADLANNHNSDIEIENTVKNDGTININKRVNAIFANSIGGSGSVNVDGGTLVGTFVEDNGTCNNLDLKNGASYDFSGNTDSTINKLSMTNDSIIKLDSTKNITVANYSGNGIVEFNSKGHLHIDGGFGSFNLTNKDLTTESISGLTKEEIAIKFNEVASKLGIKDNEQEIKAEIVLAEGEIVGETTGVVTFVAPNEGDTDTYYHGSVEVKNITEKANTKNEALSNAGIGMKLHNRAHMNDMNKRLGELRDANGEHGVWTRMVRGESEYKNTKAQYNQYQLGYDEKLSVDKRWTVGAAVTFSEGDASYGYGSTEDKSTAFAIYGSKLNNDGTFVDLIARYAHLESDVDDQAGKGSYSANGMSVSAEFGKRIQQGKGLWIEPQVELTYGTLDSAELQLGGKTVQIGDVDSLIGRVGFRIGQDIEQGNVYARASYMYDFDGETKTTFSNATATRDFNDDLGGGWWEVGVGANINLSKATYIYADVEKTFGGEVDTNWQWNLGVRYSF